MNWWCCSAEFGEHTKDCLNYKAEYMEEPMEKLKPCPFCGEKELIKTNNQSYLGEFPQWAVNCQTCSAKGPVTDTERKAFILWNTSLTQ
jgi:Lar family restriction alleviation protein